MLSETEILNLEKRLQAEHQADLAAVRRVLRLLREKQLDSSEPDALSDGIPVHHPELPIASPNGSIESRVLSTVQKMNGRFTFSQLMEALLANFPTDDFNRKTISGVMFRNKGTKFRVVESGRGRKGAIYERFSEPK